MLKWIKTKWSDPVWSEVFAGLIVTVIIAIMTVVWAFIKSEAQKISLTSAFRQIVDFLLSNSIINNGILTLLFALFAFTLLNILRKGKQNSNAKKSSLLTRVIAISTLIMLIFAIISMDNSPDISAYSNDCEIKQTIRTALRHIKANKNTLEEGSANLLIINAYEEKLTPLMNSNICNDENEKAMILNDVNKIYSILPLK